MSYLVFARKFRPQSFSEVSGQEHVTKTLSNSIERQRIAHAYLFTGPRGVGKTSIARIFAKSLNCIKGPTVKPCQQCSNCIEIAQGSNLAVREIDGASHNSVDNVRELIESFRALPPPGSLNKIYIIDEVHMLSLAAFNALLKSLEEPPPHTIFVLATTDAHKIPETVVSRCQRHDFRTLTEVDVIERLTFIAKTEKFKIDPEALRMIARLSEGSMRDAQSLLDRVHAFCEGTISANEVGKVVGTVERSKLFEISQAIFSRDPAQALSVVTDTFSTGIDPALFLKEFVGHFRDLLLAKVTEQDSETLSSEAQIMQQQVQSMSTLDLQDLVHLAREGGDTALRSAFPKYALEALVVRMATRIPALELRTIIDQMGKGAETSTSVSAGRAPIAKPAAKGVVPQAPVAPTQPGTAKKNLSWQEFVQLAASSGFRMLFEQLKRLHVETFQAGLLKAHGPEFSIGYLKEPEHKKKLDQLLASYAGEQKWHVHLEKGVLTSPEIPGSLHQIEVEEERSRTKARTNDLQNHPKVKSLQKVFPGSQVEAVRIKDHES